MACVLSINMYGMPRLSIFKPEKGNDYKFFDRNIKEMFQVGGTDLHFHKYIGPYDQGATQKDGDASPTQPDYQGQENVNETTIQDLLFLENRDRKYSDDIYELRGTYNVSDSDFDLTQFGMFLQNDTLFINFHIDTMVSTIGRKLMAGDVIELPHLRDDLLLDDRKDAINRFYVITDASRPSEGFDPNWWPHMWRCKLGQISDSQEYRDIIGYGDEEDDLRNIISTYKDEIDISLVDRQLPSSYKFEFVDLTDIKAGDYYYLRVTGEEGEMIWSSPVYIGGFDVKK